MSGAVAVASFVRFRRREVRAGLARPFALVAGLFAVFGLAYAGLRLATSVGSQASWIGYFVVVLPWTVFAARYVGMGRYVTRRRVLGGVTVVTAIVATNVVVGTFDGGPLSDATARTLETTQAVVALAVVTFVFVLIAAVVAATYTHRQLPTAQGVLVALPTAVLVFVFQATRPATPLVNDLLVAGGFVTVAGSLALGVTRYDVLTRPPGTWIRGERAALTETDEAIVVLDDDQRIVRCNESAVQTFGDVETLDDVTDHSTGTLAERKTVTCVTTTGRRQFEPSVSPLVDEFDELLGHTVTMIDVTEREIRRQRLGVLNRILRHNVRNELDVIRAHAEEETMAPAIASVDRLGRLSEETRRVQELMERSTADRTPTELRPLLEDVVDSVTAGSDADASVAVPDLTVTVDPELCRYAVRHLVENAVEHNDTTTPQVAVFGERTDSGVRIVVADDGPGIPESERVVTESGEERPLEHASSLGLWGANWAVQTIGGSLSFAESDLGGTAVVISLPGVTTHAEQDAHDP